MTINLKDLALLKDPTRWPVWPFMPVKKFDRERHEFICRIIHASRPLRVVDGNLYRLPPASEEFQALPYTDYKSAEELLAEWRLD